VTIGYSPRWVDGDTFYGQSTVYEGVDGSLRHVTRVGIDVAWDETDGSQLWHSGDGGASWACSTTAAGGYCAGHTCAPTQRRACANATAGFGWPGTMYNSFLRLADGRVLDTFTQRCNGPGPRSADNACRSDGFGTGLRGLLSYDDGKTFDFGKDYMVLAAGDDDNNPLLHTTGCACGYGATIQFADGTLGTPYCYSNTTLAKECAASQASSCFVTVGGWAPPSACTVRDRIVEPADNSDLPAQNLGFVRWKLPQA
jgi:hypothetical protein